MFIIIVSSVEWLERFWIFNEFFDEEVDSVYFVIQMPIISFVCLISMLITRILFTITKYVIFNSKNPFFLNLRHFFLKFMTVFVNLRWNIQTATPRHFFQSREQLLEVSPDCFKLKDFAFWDRRIKERNCFC